jgi:hypothetical protein
MQDIYDQTLQIKQNITPAHVTPFKKLTVKKERETEQREI